MQATSEVSHWSAASHTIQWKTNFRASFTRNTSSGSVNTQAYHEVLPSIKWKRQSPSESRQFWWFNLEAGVCLGARSYKFNPDRGNVGGFI